LNTFYICTLNNCFYFKNFSYILDDKNFIPLGDYLDPLWVYWS